MLAVSEFGRLDKDCVEIISPRDKVPAEKLETLAVVNVGSDFHMLDVLEVGHDFLRISACTQAGRGIDNVGCISSDCLWALCFCVFWHLTGGSLAL